MSGSSAIEWTDATWNPVTGCDRVSPGCAACYALAYAARLKAMGQPKYQRDGGPASGPGFGVTLHEQILEEPLRWRRPRRVFVNSMSDLFHELVPFDYIDRVFAVMALADRHIFQVLTKRPERMRDYFAHNPTGKLCHGTRERIAWAAEEIARERGENVDDPWWDVWLELWPLRHIWLGTSIENRRYVHRADTLREVPAAVRFISAEPLLGPLTPDLHILDETHVWQADGSREHYGARSTAWSDGYEGPGLDLDRIDWLIVGGESGGRPGRRLVDEHGRPRADRIGWVRDLRDACADMGVAFFLKQWGGLRPGGPRELDGRTWDEMPRRGVEAPA